MKMKCLALIATTLCVAGSVLAAATWTNAEGDGLWSTSNNWSNANIPASGDSTFIKYNNTGLTGPVFDASASQTIRNLSLDAGTLSEAGDVLTMTMTGGALNLSYFLRLGAGSTGGGTVQLDMSGASAIHALSNEGLIRVGSGYTGQINMSDNALILALDMTIDASNGSSVDLSDDAAIYLVGDRTAMVLEEIAAGGLTSQGGTVNWVGYTTAVDPNFGLITIVTSIPEPATMGLFVMVGGGLLWIRNRSRI